MNSKTRGRVRRQRCMWCGALIVEDELDRMLSPVKPDGSPPDPIPIWSPGAVIRLTGDNPKITEDINLGPNEDLPADACGNLDFEVTR